MYLTNIVGSVTRLLGLLQRLLGVVQRLLGLLPRLLGLLHRLLGLLPRLQSLLVNAQLLSAIETPSIPCTHARVQAFVQVVGNVWVKEVQMTNQIGVLQQQDPFMSNKQAGSTHVNQPNRLQSTGKSS